MLSLAGKQHSMDATNRCGLSTQATLFVKHTSRFVWQFAPMLSLENCLSTVDANELVDVRHHKSLSGESDDKVK